MTDNWLLIIRLLIYAFKTYLLSTSSPKLPYTCEATSDKVLSRKLRFSNLFRQFPLNYHHFAKTTLIGTLHEGERSFHDAVSIEMFPSLIMPATESSLLREHIFGQGVSIFYLKIVNIQHLTVTGRKYFFLTILMLKNREENNLSFFFIILFLLRRDSTAFNSFEVIHETSFVLEVSWNTEKVCSSQWKLICLFFSRRRQNAIVKHFFNFFTAWCLFIFWNKSITRKVLTNKHNSSML